jgi:N-acetylglutamate synthase-like GNAT family acetyltransferase
MYHTMTQPPEIKNNTVSCRLATTDDIDLICSSIDERVFIPAFLERSIASSHCYVAIFNDSLIVGYAVLDYSFYAQAFIAMLRIHPSYRRQRIGLTLMQYLEQPAQCTAKKLFTSTNLSNLAMQSLLTKLQYKLTGVIHNLDDDNDPELVYYKPLAV